jgi:hypothetical protein
MLRVKYQIKQTKHNKKLGKIKPADKKAAREASRLFISWFFPKNIHNYQAKIFIN